MTGKVEETKRMGLSTSLMNDQRKKLVTEISQKFHFQEEQRHRTSYKYKCKKEQVSGEH